MNYKENVTDRAEKIKTQRKNIKSQFRHKDSELFLSDGEGNKQSSRPPRKDSGSTYLTPKLEKTTSQDF